MAITPNTNKLNFHEIKAELKDFLKSQDKLKDYNFEGSVINSVLDVLAYTTHYNAFNANMAVNESFLDTSQLRSSAVSHAKLLGYTPRSYSSSRATVDITPASTDYMERGHEFSSITADGEEYQFIVESDVNASANGFETVALVQGVYIQDQYRYNGGDTDILYLTHKNANTDTLVVSVERPNITYGVTTNTYKHISEISDILTEDNIYWLQENKNGLFSVYFGDDIIGKALENNDIVTLSYIAGTIEDPKEGNNIQNIIDPAGTHTINMLGMQTRLGSPKESIDSIKFNAPLSYASQNRAVAADDYKALINSEIPNLLSVNVWGGESEIPSTPGIVYISAISDNINNYLDLNIKNNIINIISSKNVLGVDVKIKDHEKIDLILDVKYTYNNRASKNIADISNAIKAAVILYNDNTLLSFSGVFRKSNLLSIIDSISPNVLDSSVDVIMSKTINIIDTIQRDTIYNIALKDTTGFNSEWNEKENTRPQIWSFKVDFTEKLNDAANNVSVMTSTVFNYNNTSCIFKDRYDNYNKRRMIDIISNKTKDVVQANVGYVDAINGQLNIDNYSSTLQDLITTFSSSNITFKATPYSNSIYPKFNNILNIEETDIVISPIANNS